MLLEYECGPAGVILKPTMGRARDGVGRRASAVDREETKVRTLAGVPPNAAGWAFEGDSQHTGGAYENPAPRCSQCRYLRECAFGSAE